MYTAEQLEAELAWESKMVDIGIDRFNSAQLEARTNGRGEETSAGMYLMREYIESVTDAVTEWCAGTAYQTRSERDLIGALDPKMVAMISLKAILSRLHARTSVPTVADDIGSRIEDELLMARFHETNASYLEEIFRRLENRGTTNRKYMRNSVIGSFRSNGEQIEYWSTTQRTRIGLTCIGIAVTACDLFEIVTDANRSSGGTWLCPTDAAKQFLDSHDAAMSELFPDRMPMIVPPDDWTSPLDGGYIHPKLRQITPMIIKSPLLLATSNHSDPKWAKPYIEADMPKVYETINHMQRTGWRINARVLDVLHTVISRNLGTGIPNTEPLEIPPAPIAAGVKPADLAEDDPKLAAFQAWKMEARMLHDLEAERVAKARGIFRIARMAHAVSGHSAIYFVYRADFRGRIYSAVSGLSPQGPEAGKAVLQFAKGKVLGERGWHWLRVSGAARYGADKGRNFNQRVEWIDERRADWLAVAGDPIQNRHIWGEADEPYQFLAWCFDYADALAHPSGDPTQHRSHLPVGMDGSCNGIQHFSAMLRDPIGGHAVNLIRTPLPTDIYQFAADRLTDNVGKGAARGDALSNAFMNWLAFMNKQGMDRFPRDLPKPPVMTLPYGSTRQACTAWVHKWSVAKDKDFFPAGTAFNHSIILANTLWDSLGEIVVGARGVMNWLMQCSTIAVKAGKDIKYVSPLGFPVHQRVMKFKTERVQTYLSGGIKIAVRGAPTKIDSLRMRNSAAPNFVHNADSSHMCLTVCAGAEQGITHFAMIHDDFGTHAADIELMQTIIRQQFVALYEEHDILQSFKDQLEEYTGAVMPDVPAKGDLDIRQVLDSPNFFS